MGSGGDRARGCVQARLVICVATGIWQTEEAKQPQQQQGAVAVTLSCSCKPSGFAFCFCSPV